MNMFRLWRLFHRSGTRGTSGRTSALAIVAFASATAVFLTVLGGLHGFIWRASADHTFGCMINSNRCAPGTYETWSKTLAHADKLVATVGDGHWTADQATAVMNTYSDGYVLLAAFASLLLIVPFVALAGSAARLAASRRDARLAALRRLGLGFCRCFRGSARFPIRRGLRGGFLRLRLLLGNIFFLLLAHVFLSSPGGNSWGFPNIRLRLSAK